MVKRHLLVHKTQICLGGKVNTPKNPVESLPRNAKMRAGFALLSTGIFRIRFAGDAPAANLTHRPKIFSQISQNACNLSKKRYNG